MASILWLSEVAFAYFLTSFLVAVCVGRFLRHSSRNDFGAIDCYSKDCYSKDESLAVSAREVTRLHGEVACVP